MRTHREKRKRRQLKQVQLEALGERQVEQDGSERNANRPPLRQNSLNKQKKSASLLRLGSQTEMQMRKTSTRASDEKFLLFVSETHDVDNMSAEN